MGIGFGDFMFMLVCDVGVLYIDRELFLRIFFLVLFVFDMVVFFFGLGIFVLIKIFVLFLILFCVVICVLEFVSLFFYERLFIFIWFFFEVLDFCEEVVLLVIILV